jgi:hypothetical protein
MHIIDRAINESSSSEPGLAHENLSRVESSLWNASSWKNLAQARLVTIQASSWADSWANTYTLIKFDI